MSKKRNVPKLCAQLLIASLALTAAASAQACHRWYQKAGCAAQAAADRARQAAEAAQRAAEAAAAAARAEAERAAAAAAAAAAEADRLAKEEAARIAAAAAAAAKLAADGAAISTDEMRNLNSLAKAAYNESVDGVKSAYDSAVAGLKSILDAALEALFRAAGRAFVDGSKDVLEGMVVNMTKLDAEGKQALNRIRKAIPAKQITEQTRQDMYTLGSKLGLITGQANSRIPRNVSRSSFGVMVSVGASAVVGGAGAMGIVMQTFLENGQFRVGLVGAVDASIGPQASAPGAEIGLFWAPGGIDDATGPSVGFSIPLNPLVGLELGWGVSAGMVGAQNAIPGFTISIPIIAIEPNTPPPGDDVPVPPKFPEFALHAGYTKVLAKF